VTQKDKKTKREGSSLKLEVIGLSASLECGGLAPLCYRAERGPYSPREIARSARGQSGARPPHSKEGLNISGRMTQIPGQLRV